MPSDTTAAASAGRTADAPRPRGATFATVTAGTARGVSLDADCTYAAITGIARRTADAAVTTVAVGRRRTRSQRSARVPTDTASTALTAGRPVPTITAGTTGSPLPRCPITAVAPTSTRAADATGTTRTSIARNRPTSATGSTGSTSTAVKARRTVITGGPVFTSLTYTAGAP